MDVLVVDEAIGTGAVVVVVAGVAAVVVEGAVVVGNAATAGGAVTVVSAVIVGGAVIVVGVVDVVVVVGHAAVVGGGRKDYIEADWRGGTRGGIVEVEGVGVGDPTFVIAGDSRMGTFVDRGQNRKMRQRIGVVAAQGAWMAACRYGRREIAREDFDGDVVVVVDVSRLAVGSSFGRVDVEALNVGYFSLCLAANVVIDSPLGFGLFLEATRLVPLAPGSTGRS